MKTDRQFNHLPADGAQQSSTTRAKAWPDLHVSEMLKHWRGGTTANQITRLLPVNPATGISYTRSSILGKLHRLGDVSRKAQPRGKKLGRLRKRFGGSYKRTVAGHNGNRQTVDRSRGFVSQEFIGPLVSVLFLSPSSCRWPIGDPREGRFGFCGGKCVAEKSYCETHLHLSQQKFHRYRRGAFRAHELEIITKHWNQGRGILNISQLLNRKPANIRQVAVNNLGLRFSEV